MIEIYTFSEVLKDHPIYRHRRDDIHNIYRQLASKGALNVTQLCRELSLQIGELHTFFDKNLELFKMKQDFNSGIYQQGIRWACFGELNYPKSFYEMTDPPLVISYRGNPCWMSGDALAVVGSREPGLDSIAWMEKELPLFLDKVTTVIVSGGARGIDQKAHSMAIRRQRPTVVVLPSGLGSIYPDSLRTWTDSILDAGGCLLSEYPYHQKMHKYLFHHRNRLIAAMGIGTLLVEARRRSGTLITAHLAAQLGRSVYVVPGHPLDIHFQGSVDLLQDGAQMIRDAEDLISFYLSDKKR